MTDNKTQSDDNHIDIAVAVYQTHGCILMGPGLQQSERVCACLVSGKNGLEETC